MNSLESLFKELRNTELAGIAFKNLDLKKKILNYLSTNGNSTLTEISKKINISTPKTGKLVTELIHLGLLKDYGKTGSSVGRRPNQYGLNPDSVYFVGVEVKKDFINIGVVNFLKELVQSSEKIPYKLENTQSSLDELCSIINTFIDNLTIKRKEILGLGINLGGRVNYKTGYSYSFFYFNDTPLRETIQEKIGIPIFLENDSRAMAFGEFSYGAVNGEKNVLFINVDHGIGMGLMINGELYYGKSGFSGEFGHIPIFNNEIICHCGKKGCLETEASGNALINAFKQKLREGASSIITMGGKPIDDIRLEDIIKAANNDDVLAIELIGEIGDKIGRGIALLINLFNPELVIIGGSLSSTGDTIKLPVKSAINKYSLSIVNNDTEIKISTLGEKAGVIGACLLVRERLFN